MKRLLVCILLLFSMSLFADTVHNTPAFINQLDNNKVNAIQEYKDDTVRTFETYKNKNNSTNCMNLSKDEKLAEAYQSVGSPSFVVFYNRELNDDIYEPKSKVTILDQYGTPRDIIKKIYLPLRSKHHTLNQKEMWEFEKCTTQFFNVNGIQQVDRSLLLRAGQASSQEQDSVQEIEIKSLSKGADYLMQIIFSGDKHYNIKIIKLENGMVVYNGHSMDTNASGFKKSRNNDFANVSGSTFYEKYSETFSEISINLINHWNSNNQSEFNANDRINKQDMALGTNGYSKSTVPKTDAKKGKSSGTGFIISKNGHILTNSHVVNGSNQISVELNGTTYNAKLLEEDKHNDIALLRIEKENTPFISLNQDKIKKGSSVCALGYPLVNLQGKELKATFGNVNSLSGFQGDPRYYQMDSAIQPGNSGGPLLDKSGNVVGIVSAKLNQMATLKAAGSFNQNVNYALKISYVIPILKKHNVEIKDASIAKVSNENMVEKASKSVVFIVSE